AHPPASGGEDLNHIPHAGPIDLREAADARDFTIRDGDINCAVAIDGRDCCHPRGGWCLPGRTPGGLGDEHVDRLPHDEPPSVSMVKSPSTVSGMVNCCTVCSSDGLSDPKMTRIRSPACSAGLGTDRRVSVWFSAEASRSSACAVAIAPAVVVTRSERYVVVRTPKGPPIYSGCSGSVISATP